MNQVRRATVFECEGSQLVGILESSEMPKRTGVLIVVGGPQYRVGSHRQFVLIARELAANNIPVFRFDYRGMGDSGATEVGFVGCSDDIQAAIDAFVSLSGVEKVVLWGLCDAASACMIFGGRDSRVSGMVLINPWVRSDAGRARSYLKHYYIRRIFSKSFWLKALSFRLNLREALGSLYNNILTARKRGDSDGNAAPLDGHQVELAEPDFRNTMLQGLLTFDGSVVFLLGGADLTAAEFEDYASNSRSWRKYQRRSTVSERRFPGMDHTFSTAEFRAEIVSATRQFIDDLD